MKPRNATVLVMLIVCAAIIVAFTFSGGVRFPRTDDSHSSLKQKPAAMTESGAPDALVPIVLTSQTIEFADGTEAAFRVPQGFALAVAAEGLGKARFMTESPDGRLFIPDMVNYNLSNEGRLLVLDGWDDTAQRFTSESVYLSGLRGPHNVAFYTDVDGNEWLYLTLTEHLVRYPYRAGDREPSGSSEVVYTFPNTQSGGADGSVWHITRTVLFDGDTMYISVGSGCNACEEDPSEDRARILAMNPDGTNARVYVEGLRNAVGLGMRDGALYATNNGADHLGAEAPNDGLYRVQEGVHYGWPYCYEQDGVLYAEEGRMWEHEPVACADTPRAFAALPPHSAPLGFAYVPPSPVAHPLFADTFLVALQGAWNLEQASNGYELVRVSATGTVEVLVDGFLTTERERIGRPVGVTPWRQGYLLSDDHNGRLYYLYSTEGVGR